MEAASIPWRPLGRLLVEQGLLGADELERALEQQERTGRRLGETLVECGFVSGPELSHALAAQYGIELTAETGFGTGLRTEIQRRHETERRGFRPVLSAVDPVEPATEGDAEPEATAELEESAQAVQAQLEEQWAKLAAAEERLVESHRELTALAHEYDQRRSQAARLAQRARHAREQLGSRHEHGGRMAQLEHTVRGRDAELDRLRSECVDLRGRLAGAEAAAADGLGDSHRELVALAREYDRRRGQATRFAQHARRARERHAEIDRLRDGLAEADLAVVERDRLLDGLRQERERRRAQAVRFLQRARESTATGEQLRASLIAAEERLGKSRRELAELAGEHDRRRSQAKRLAQRARQVREQLDSQHDRDERIARLEDDVRRRDAELERAHEERERASTATEERLAAAAEQLNDSRRELASQRERRRSQLTRFIARVRERDARIERLAADVRGCDAELDRLRHELETRPPEQVEGPAPLPLPASHLVFVHLSGRYELVEQAGPPPARNTVLELPELHRGPLVVAGLARSPLPGDTRPCAFLTPTP